MSIKDCVDGAGPVALITGNLFNQLVTDLGAPQVLCSSLIYRMAFST